MTAAPLRVARGTAVATVAVLLAVTGHVAASATAPTPTPLAVAGGLLVLVGAIVASARSWTPARLLVALGGVQVVSHLVLAGPGGPVDPRLAGLAPTAHAHAHGAALTPGMLAAHLVAAALAAALLARVDTAVTTLWHLVRHLLHGLRLELLVLPAPLRPAPVAPVVRARGRSAVPSPSRRGPPAFSCP